MPAGMQIARYYCPTAHQTFSLLPDCLASRFPGELDTLEHIVASAEGATSVEAAADRLRDDTVTLPSAVRWLRRRLTLVRLALLAVVTARPDLFGPTRGLSALRVALGTTGVLMRLRGHPQVPLAVVPRPLGFGHRLTVPGRVRTTPQHAMGPDADRPSG
jgi:hypothetical protein